MSSVSSALVFSTLMGTALGASFLAFSIKAPMLLAGGGGVLVMALSPAVAYYTIAATLPVAAEVAPGLTVVMLVLAAALACIGANVVVGRCQLQNPFRWPEGYVALIFFALVFLSLLRVDDYGLAAANARPFVTFAIYYFLTLAFVQDAKTVRRLVWLLIVVGVVQAAVTIAQVQLRFVLPGQFRVTPRAGGTYAYLTRQYVRAEGTTINPLVLAAFLQSLIVLGVTQLFYDRRVWMKFALLGGVGLMIYAWLNTYARSSVVAMGVMAIAAAAMRFKVARRLTAVLVLMAALALLFSNVSPTGLVAMLVNVDYFRRVGSDPSTSTAIRIETAVGAWNLFLAHPLLGVGIGLSGSKYDWYLPSWASSPLHPIMIHNAFMQAAADLGILGLLTLLGLWALAFRGAQRARANPELGPYPAAVLVVLIGLFAYENTLWWIRDIWIFLALGSAIGRIGGRVS